MRIFFTSDTHFGHEGIIPHCKRPFASVEEMDAAMERNWNAAVGLDDVVYHLGDFAWHNKPTALKALLGRLNGVKHLVAGNHDHKMARKLPWASVSYAVRLKHNGMRIYLSHYPVLGFREDLHFHGHQHNPTPFRVLHQVDVGVDAWSYRPVSLEQILSSAECFVRPKKVAA